jgi:uncharacterized protein (DUF433 family)
MPPNSETVQQQAPLKHRDNDPIRIGSSRVPLDSVVHEFMAGATAKQIQGDFPSLSLREIHGALSYYLDHQEQVEDCLRQRELEAAKVGSEIEDLPRIDARLRRIQERNGR